MKAGDRITVYCDPLSELHPEGRVTLIQRIDKGYDPFFERWECKFDGEGEPVVQRNIKVAEDVPDVEK